MSKWSYKSAVGGNPHDEANEIKLEESVQDLPKLDRRILLCTKNTGSWLTARGTMVTGTLLSDMEFFDSFCNCYNLIHSNLAKNVTVITNPSPYVMHLIINTENLSSHVTMKCVVSSSTSRNVPFNITVSFDKPPFNMPTAELTSRYVVLGDKKRLGGTSYLGGSGNIRLTPSLTSYLGIPTVTPTSRSQLSALLLGGEIKKDKHSKPCHNQWKHFSPLVLSFDGIIGNYVQFLLASYRFWRSFLPNFCTSKRLVPILEY